MFDPADPNPEYELAWPRELFVAEGRLTRAGLRRRHLDWVFWWYLATVELTNRLLARQGR
jgi:hypothetical protein